MKRDVPMPKHHNGLKKMALSMSRGKLKRGAAGERRVVATESKFKHPHSPEINTIDEKEIKKEQGKEVFPAVPLDVKETN